MSPLGRSTRIKLLKFVALFAYGGTERQFSNLALNLDPDRFELSFGCIHRTGQFLPPIEQRGIPIHEYPMRRFLSARGARQELRFARHIARERLDIVHSYNFYANMFALPAAWMAGAPVIIASIRDEGAYMTDRQIVAQKHACRLADVVAVNAESIKRWLIRTGYRASNIVVIPNGIETSRFVDMRPRWELRTALGIPRDVPVVAMFARLIKKKGVDHMVDAAMALHEKWPDVRFLVVGAAPTVDAGATPEEAAFVDGLKQRVADRGLQERILFTGFRNDVPELMSVIDVSVLPSMSEGLSNSVLESMAAGRATISTDVGGMREAMQDGVSGMLVPPHDVGAVVQAVDRLLAEPALARRLGAEGRRVVFDRYSIDRMVRSTERLYTSLLAEKTAQRRWPFRPALRMLPREFQSPGGTE
jgi:glycosyltransferase involved in cell wall biosynthesis